MNAPTQTIRNISGGSAAGSGPMVPFLQENAIVIGLGFTAFTFTIYATCSAFDQWYKWKQNKLDTALKEKKLKED